jgi:PAS domain S-box-containing protein
MGCSGVRVRRLIFNIYYLGLIIIKVVNVLLVKPLVFLCLIGHLLYGVAYGEGFVLSGLADQRNIVFNRLGTEDGLSQTSITAITQDGDGFIWVGTSEGLNRFDGYNFETFFHFEDQVDSISDATIWDILSDSSGDIWIATEYGLNKFNETNKTFSHFFLSSESSRGGEGNKVFTLFEDSKNRLWIGTGVGLTLRTQKGLFTDYRIENGHEKTRSVRSIFEDTKGNIWVGTQEDGLYRINETSHQLEPVRNALLRDLYVRDILEDDDGKIWISTFSTGIHIFDPETNNVNVLGNNRLGGLVDKRIRVMLKDLHGDIWIGSDNGLSLWLADRGEFTQYSNDPTDVHSLSDNNVLEIFQDTGGVIWVGTYNGLSRWNAGVETFPHFKVNTNQKGGLNSNAITSFAETSTGDVWVGTFDGLDKWIMGSNTFVHYGGKKMGLTNDKVMSIYEQNDILWVGTMTGGVNLVQDGEVIGFFLHNQFDEQSLSSNAVSSIYEDKSGSIWITTYGGGVNKYLGDGKFKRYPEVGNEEGSFSSLRTLDILEANDGKFWIATDDGGVVVLDSKNGQTEIHRNRVNDATSVSSDDIISLLSNDEYIWVGTRDRGLNRFNNSTSTFDRLSKVEGLASDSVYGLLIDTEDRLWISGGKGLSVYDQRSKKFTHYDSTHGLQNDDFNSGASLKLKDDSFLFGGNNGFNAFYPNRIQSNSYIPPIKITHFSKFNKPFALTRPVFKSEKIELDYTDSVIGFGFAAMDFTAPQKNKFRFKLEGFDDDWVEADTTRMTYTNLDAGDYVFRVLGSNNDDVWNNVGASLKVTVNPPIWATWWAYLLYMLGGIALLYQFQKANEQRLRRETEKRYNERLQLYIESLEEATDCVLIADANKHLMYANNAINGILGITPPEAIGQSIFSLLFSENTDANLARNGLRTEGRWHGEIKSNKGDGFLTTEITIAAVHDGRDNETAFVSIARDVTDRKKTEAELEKHRHGLQNLVDERTKLLQHEISENKAVQSELANSLKEKELLLKEVHHRVKNNMQVISSLLNIQAETIANDQFAELLGESQQRIKSMSLIHENLYQSDNLLEIDFKDYINMLANSLHRFYSVPGSLISLDIQVDNVALDIETAVPCGLIINELISNALKHAFKDLDRSGTITINFRGTGCQYVLEIQDDGVGLPSGFTLDSSSSMGMEIVTILTQQLDGRLQFESDHGTRFEISFPRKDKNVG